jgi:arylsulfatase A-like enzyme
MGPDAMIEGTVTRAATATAIAAAVFPIARAAGDTDSKPNVMFLAMDDLNDWIGCLGGHPQPRTPPIDRLASEGMLISSAYTPATSCAPSRIAVPYGMASYGSGVYRHDEAHKNGTEWPCTQLPMARVCQKNGCYTAGCGKTFHGGQGHEQGWDAYERNFPEVKATPIDLGPDVRLECGIQDTGDDGRTADGQLTDWAIAQLLELNLPPSPRPLRGCANEKPDSLCRSAGV